MKNHRAWSEEDDRRLLDLVEIKRKPRLFAAAVLKRTTAAVAGRLIVLRASKRKRANPDQTDAAGH